jgi:prefoldin beta subunit
MENVNAYLQAQLKRAQQLQQQLETVVAQKYQMEIMAKEIEKTLEELGKLSGGERIYRAVGAIMVEVKDVEKLKEELKEEKELLEMRIKTMEKQQKLLEDKYREVQQEVMRVYQGGAPGGGVS